MNPFEWTGPSFLVFFLVLSLGCWVAAYFLRRMLRQPGSMPEHEIALTPAEVSYLSGGALLTWQAAAASLVHRGACCFKPSPPRLEVAEKLEPSVSELEKEIHNLASQAEGFPLSRISSAAASSSALEPIDSHLHELGLLVPDGKKLAVRVVPFLIALVPAVFGSVKILIGIARDRPVGFLAFGCFAAGVVAILFLAWRIHRSYRGDLVRRQLRARNYALQHTAQTRQSACSPDDLTLGIALFGTGVLAGSPLGALGTSFGSNSSGGSSSCGSSCGGGGGCGGGCGGCSG